MQSQEYKIPPDFLEKNSKFWPEVSGSGKYVLVSLLVGDHEYYNVNLISAKLMAEIFNLEPVALLESPKQTELIKLVDSYHIRKKIFLSDCKLSLLLRLGLLAQSIWHWLTARTKQRRLDFRYKGFLIGHYIYDTYLRRGVGTIRLNDPRYARFTWWGLRQFHIYRKIFQERKYQIFFGPDQAYVGGGIPAIVAISQGIVVWYRSFGPKKAVYRACRTFADLDVFSGHPDPAEFAWLWQHEREKAVAWADDYLSKIFAGIVNADNRDLMPAYSKSRQLSEAEYDEFFRTPRKKRVFIFSHVFVDAPHLYRQGLYEDYEIWLRETLAIAAQRKDVLWIVKLHPSESSYFLKTGRKGVDVFKDFAGYENIKLFPEGASTASLVNVMDALVTMRGTAAVEYASFGVPVITAGRNMFSGFGFEAEPASREEYKKILLTSSFPRLTAEQAARAKVSLYLYNNCNRINLPLFKELNQDIDLVMSPEVVYNHLFKVLPKHKYQDLLDENYKNYVIKKFNQKYGM